MCATEKIQPSGEKMRRAIQWISEATLSCPDKNRGEILREAQMRFDLSPMECEFLTNNFGKAVQAG